MNDRHPDDSEPPQITRETPGSRRVPRDGTADEWVSAVLDGEADAEESAAVRADPVLLARLARFQDLRDRHRQLALDPPPSPADVDQRVAAALAEMGATSGSGHRPDLVASGHARPERSTRVPRGRSWVAIAAAVVLVVVAAGVAVRATTGRSGTGEHLADSATEVTGEGSGSLEPPTSTTSPPFTSPAPAGASGAGTSSEESAPSGSPTNSADRSAPVVSDERLAELPDLGTHADTAAMVAATPTSTLDSLPLRDPATLPCRTGGPDAVRVAVAVVAGSPALVILTGDTVRAVSVPGCLPLP